MSLSQIASAGTKLLVLGDSLSAGYGLKPQQGWVSLLDKQLKQDYPCVEVINASISGDTTQQGQAKLADLIEKNKPHFLIVELGGNDGLRGLALSATKANLKKILTTAKENDIHVLLFQMTLPPNYGKAYISQFEAIYPALAKSFGATLVPFFLSNVAQNPALMQADGIHPNANAQPTILENVWPFIKDSLPDCS